MTSSIQEILSSFEGQPLSRQLLLSTLADYKRPHDKIADLVAHQLLIPVKRGMFVPGPAARIKGPEPYLLANHLLGPSYVSLETAMSHWRMIPEQVFEISSVTTVRSQVFDTPVGRFSYAHLPLPYYAFGQQRVALAENQVVLMAAPEKALCDKIILTAGLRFRSAKQMRDWLLDDMRMDRDVLRELNPGLIGDWCDDAPKKESLRYLVQTLPQL